jgi:hypothetical protein
VLGVPMKLCVSLPENSIELAKAAVGEGARD